MPSAPAPPRIGHGGRAGRKAMDQPEQPYREIEALREHLSRLSEASLRINEVPVA